MEMSCLVCHWVDKEFGKRIEWDFDLDELKARSPSAFADLESAVIYANEVLHGRAV